MKWSASELGPGTYPYCQLEMWANYATCDPVSKDKQTDCATACSAVDRDFKNELDKFKQHSYSLNDFIEAQSNYERVLHKLNKQEGFRARVNEDITDLTAQLATIEQAGIDHPSQLDHDLEEKLKADIQESKRFKTDLNIKIKAIMDAWRAKSTE